MAEGTTVSIAEAGTTTMSTPRRVRTGVVELPGSQAGPGGPPVRVDPSMVDASTAARMRPSADARHA